MEPDADTDKACVPVTWFGASATLVFEYGAFVAPFLAIPFDWCGLWSVRCWYEKSAAARDGYIVAAR